MSQMVSYTGLLQLGPSVLFPLLSAIAACMPQRPRKSASKRRTVACDRFSFLQLDPNDELTSILRDTDAADKHVPLLGAALELRRPQEAAYGAVGVDVAMLLLAGLHDSSAGSVGEDLLAGGSSRVSSGPLLTPLHLHESPAPVLSAMDDTLLLSAAEDALVLAADDDALLATTDDALLSNADDALLLAAADDG
jgi:hypothetical protein